MIGSRIPKQRNIDQLFNNTECDQTNDGADYVEGKVNNGGSLCIFGCTHGGKNRGYAGTNVLTHDDGNCRAKGDLSGRGQRLQNTDRCRGGLNDSRENSTGKYTEDGVGEGNEQLLESGNILESLDGARHGLHTEHQRSKAQKNHAGIFFLAALAEHKVNNTDQGKNGGERGRLKQLYPQNVAVKASKAEDPGSYGGTDVGTHDDVDCLAKCH